MAASSAEPLGWLGAGVPACEEWLRKWDLLSVCKIWLWGRPNSSLLVPAERLWLSQGTYSMCMVGMTRNKWNKLKWEVQTGYKEKHFFTMGQAVEQVMQCQPLIFQLDKALNNIIWPQLTLLCSRGWTRDLLEDSDNLNYCVNL